MRISDIEYEEENRIIRKLYPSKKITLVLLAVNMLAVIIVISIFYVNHNRGLLLYDQQAAERWKTEDTQYASVSLFTSRDGYLSPGDIKEIESSINKKLFDDSLLDVNSENRVWIDAYSGRTQDEIRKDESLLTVNVNAVGGDFFQIHPIPLLGGSYLDMESSDFNQILLDENVAWNLFGSNNVAGMKLWIGSSVFTVTGVVAVDRTEDNYQAYGDYDSVYIPIQAYTRSAKNSADASDYDDGGQETGNSVRVTCYEAVMPNPVKNYAFNTLSEAADIQMKSDEEKEKSRTGLNFGDKEIIENSGRFSVFSLINRSRSRKYIDMKTNAIVYPYWENVARYEETRQTGTLYLCLFLLIIPFISLIYAFFVIRYIFIKKIREIRRKRW